jgi:hypothetical protein
MTSQAILIGIIVSVFFAGLGGGYALFQFYDQPNYAMMTPQQMQQMMNNPQLRQQMYSQMIQNKQFMQGMMRSPLMANYTKDVLIQGSGQPESKISSQDTNSEIAPPLEVKVSGEKQVRRGTTHTIEIQVTRGVNPIEGARVFIDIEDYGENIIKEFKGFTDSQGFFVFSWEIPQSFDDVETLFAIIDVTDGWSSKTVLFKFQVYCLPGEQNCKAKGN